MGAKKKTGEPTSAAFNVTKQEEVVKKEIHIVGQRVKYYREKKGIEQMALAEMLGVKSNAISNWEHGRTRPDLNQKDSVQRSARLSQSSLSSRNSWPQVSMFLLILMMRVRISISIHRKKLTVLTVYLLSAATVWNRSIMTVILCWYGVIPAAES